MVQVFRVFRDYVKGVLGCSVWGSTGWLQGPDKNDLKCNMVFDSGTLSKNAQNSLKN